MNRVYFGSTDTYLFTPLDSEPANCFGNTKRATKSSAHPTGLKSWRRNWSSLGSYDFKLHCVDAATGKSNWVYESSNYINGSPAIAKANRIRRLRRHAARHFARRTASRSKEIDAGAYIAASVATGGYRAYFGHYENAFLCVDLEKGTSLDLSRQAVSLFFLAGGQRRSRGFWRTRQTTALREPQYGSSPLDISDARQSGQFARHLRRQSRGRLGRWTAYLVSLTNGKELWSYEIGQPVAVRRRLRRESRGRLR